MKKWEYKCLRFKQTASEEIVEEKLNSMGSEGWRVIHVSPEGTVLMEREKKENPKRLEKKQGRLEND